MSTPSPSAGSPTDPPANATTRVLLPVADRRETMATAWRLLRSRPGPLTLAAATYVIAGLCGLVAPWVLGGVVDAVAAGRADAESTVIRAVCWIAAAAVVGGVLTAVSSWALAAAAEPALAEIREEVFDRALGLDTARLEEAGTGDLLSRVGDDVRAVAQSLVEVVPLLRTSIVAIVLTVGGLFALDWRLALAGLLTAPLYLWSLLWYLPRSAPYYARERVAIGERAEALVGGMHAERTLRAFSRGQEQLSRITATSNGARVIALDVFRLLTRFLAHNNAVEMVGMISIMATGFLLVRADAASVGAVTAAALYFHRLFNPIGALLVLFDELQSAGAALARLAGAAMIPRPERAESSTGTTGSDAVGRLELVGVGHHYGDGTPVLNDVDLRLDPGERVAIVGRTGAGKTTLGAIAAGVMSPSSGTVSIDGAPVRDGGPLRDKVVLVSQELHVFDGTIRENLDLARPGADDRQLEQALTVAGAWGWVAALPQGLDSRVGSDGRTLSAAQTQQLALARVALRDPAVVVLDEATAEAGSQGARQLESAAMAITRNRTALIIAHRLTQAAAADRIVVMEQGEIVEQGSHTELVERGGRYGTLWAAWTASAG